MIGCNETITLVKHITGNTTDTYTCTIINGCSWFSRTSIVTDGNGAKPQNTYEIRIFSALNGNEPNEGDYCVKGTVTGTITKPSDLKEYECFRITSVGNNRRGSLGHWRVSGS